MKHDSFAVVGEFAFKVLSVMTLLSLALGDDGKYNQQAQSFVTVNLRAFTS